MNSRVAALIVPLIAVGLFIAAPAQAKQPIPGITQTGQWRALKTYVNDLQTKRNTPATAVQKTTFRQRLNTKQAAANARVKKLFVQRRQRIINRDTAREQKQIKKLQNAANRQVGKLTDQRSERLATAKLTFAAQIARIRNRYAGALAKDNRQLSRLERNLRRTRNPFQRQIILAHIDTIEKDIAQLKRARTRNITSATSIHREKVSAIRTKYADKIAKTRAYYKGVIKKVKGAWKVIYADDVAAAKAQRTKQFGLVTNLRNRGSGDITQMPDEPTCRSTSASVC